MAELIPTITWTDLVKIVKQGKLPELKACEITFNGDHLFTAIIPHGDFVAQAYLKTQATYLAVKANISEGKEPEELLKGA